MVAKVRGPIDMDLSRDDDGYKDYHVTYLIETNSTADGPWNVINAVGLPNIGSTWVFGNDWDDWVWCVPGTRIAPVRQGGAEGEPVTFWTLEQTFTNRPMWRCQTQNIENPLLEPPRVSGTYVKFLKEARFDRNGKIIKSSSHELITGPDTEFDDNRPTVNIEITSLTLPLSDVTSMVDTVNDANLWGLSARKIKLSNISWRRLLYGVCTFYYTMSLEFEINFDTFDRKIWDVGTRELWPGWFTKDYDPSNPSLGKWTPDSLMSSIQPHPDGPVITFNPPVKLKEVPQAFVKIKDGPDYEVGWCPLDGNGRRWAGPDSGTLPGTVNIEYYPESNFLLLGIPTQLGT